ncbi:lamin tail domain-containing protein [Methylobacillus gramineus]|uniref:lamin tail domain-containing protein n=1 Tax=Methylobacillus gramineus TaxID=755169 RepID=UPI001CFFDE98|nr:lamin tail domain-containing protein [Methylobacillus gramineus]MCB5186050.1 lamin tail domain-containing protein [Methylobacillus gramineus]
MKKVTGLLMLSLFSISTLAQADVRISEWMYNTDNTGSGEFIEFTNFGGGAVDFSSWSYDDDSRNPGTVSLAAFGIVNAGESVILTELDASVFRSLWNLAADVKVIGKLTTNLGRADEINLFNGTNLVDRLTYDDRSSNGPRTTGISGVPSVFSDVGANHASAWVFSVPGDQHGTYVSNAGDIGSPGRSAFITAVPEPSSYALLAAGLVLMGFVGYRRRQDKFKL